VADVASEIRQATLGSPYEGRLYVVGGAPRDRVLGLPASQDVDLVLEGDALELARFLHRKGLSDHSPVTYPRFGTARITLSGHVVELASARAESYDPSSRKPSVARATLREDVLRRDFTINTLLENLHTGEVLDLTGQAMADLRQGIIRTPMDPQATFFDDPLRMLRAVRFAVRFGFRIEERTWRAIQEHAGRLSLVGPGQPVVSAERIRDEFLKMMLADGRMPPGREPPRELGPPSPGQTAAGRAVAWALQMLRDSGLLAQFAPELLEMVGVEQGSWHRLDVWEHTLEALRFLREDAPLELRLGLLLHDVGKPRTRTVDERGVHFYDHAKVGAEIAGEILHRLRLTNDQIRRTCALVAGHMRPGEFRPEWTDASIRRLVRQAGENLDLLLELARCDIAAMAPDAPTADLAILRARIDEVNRKADAAALRSPLDGQEIMALLGIRAGPRIREAKEHLLDEVIEGRLEPGDKEGARRALLDWWQERQAS